MGKKTKGKAGKAGKVKERSSQSNSSGPGVQSSTKRQRNSDDNDLSTTVAGASSGQPSDGKVNRGRIRGGNSGGDGEELVFEDPFGDEFDPEDVEVIQADAEDGNGKVCGDQQRVAGGALAMSDEVAMDVDGEAEETKREVQTKVWRAGLDDLAEGEELECDSTAYHMYHSLRPEWPCLSFDVIRDSLGANRSRFPHTMFAVAGTQADRADSNRLQVMKLSDLHRTSKSSDDDGEGDSEDEAPDETDDDPVLDHINIPHKGGVNRVRSMPQKPHIVATWSETSNLHIWDLEKQVSALAKGAPRTSKVDPAFTFGGHAEVI